MVLVSVILYSYTSVCFKTSKIRTTIDPHKISKEIFPILYRKQAPRKISSNFTLIQGYANWLLNSGPKHACFIRENTFPKHQFSASFDSSRAYDANVRASCRRFQVWIQAVTFLCNVGFIFLNFFPEVVLFQSFSSRFFPFCNTCQVL